MVRSEGNISLKIPVTPPEIDPGTVRLIAQHFNHYATPGPEKYHVQTEKSEYMCRSPNIVLDIYEKFG